MLFPSFEGLKVEGSFEGGDVSSDGGVQLLRLADRRLGLSAALARVLPDPRDPLKVEHTVRDLLRQRIYGLACGYEDLNDHDTLREDLCWQSAVERTRALASSPTLCRLEARADRAAAVAMHGVLLEQFIASHAEPPAELVLDFDATDDRVHGMQEGRAFHAYYGDWCFLPLYVFCGERLLCAYLRRSNADAARHAWAVLKLLCTRLRAAWPAVKITLRADSGFCRWKMLRWCDRHAVGYGSPAHQPPYSPPPPRSSAWPATRAWPNWPPRGPSRPPRTTPRARKNSGSLPICTTPPRAGTRSGA
jgi:hypothetical protein